MSDYNDALPFNMEEFLEGLNKDSQKEFQVSDRAKKVLMNLISNQGSITIVPIISKRIGNIYVKLPKVREFKGNTSVIDSDDPVWYRVLPKEFYGELSDTESQLYDEVTGLFDTVLGYEVLDFDEIRMRNYSLFMGVCMNHMNLEGAKVEDNINQPCLLVFPSLSPIDALNTAIANKKTIFKERTVDWLTKTITPNPTNRQGVIQISFKKPDAPGYNSTVTFETNNPAEFLEVVDPKRDFTEEIKKFDDPISSFIGWMNNQDNGKRFNQTVFNELKAQLLGIIEEQKLIEAKQSNDAPKTDSIPNNNGGDPMLKSDTPPIPGVEGASEKPQRPF